MAIHLMGKQNYIVQCGGMEAETEGWGGGGGYPRELVKLM